MEFVRGPVLRGVSEAEAAFPDEGDRREIGFRVADTLARSTRSTPTRSGSATSAARRTTSPASCAAGTASGRNRRPASCRRSTASTTPRGTHPGPGGASIVHGDYRLDNMILERLGRGRRGGRLGALHARRPARRRRHADGLLARTRPGRRSASASPPTWRPASRPAPSSPPATPRPPAATSPNSTSSPPSATGSWRSSSRASTPATPPAATAMPAPTPASKPSPAWSSASPRPPKRSSPVAEHSSLSETESQTAL